jgi:hypothetical protein
MNLLTMWSKLTALISYFKGRLRLVCTMVMFMLNYSVFSQVLFMEECFVGGVQTGGHATLGAITGGTYNIHWEDDYTLKTAYAICYRYGILDSHTFYFNQSPITWTNDSQAAPEQIEVNLLSNPFAVHVIEITDMISIENDLVQVDLPEQQGYEQLNWGWWGVYVILLYESPNILSEVCTRIYLADQPQTEAQIYYIETPSILVGTSVIFGIYSNRISDLYEDASRVTINSIPIGDIWTSDPHIPAPGTGVQGHYFYQNGIAEGLNGDTANATLNRHDGVSIINDYIDLGAPTQSIKIQRIISNPTGANPHPAFSISFTPSCKIQNSEMPRIHAFCRNESSEAERILQSIPGYDHYAWTPGHQLSDSTIANPICFADSSRWYRVRMWNDDGDVCPQTIPVFVEVGQTPGPRPLQVGRSTCPSPTGRITFANTAGKAPYTYTVGSTTQPDSTFRFLLPGSYDVSVTDALGCTWDSTVTVPLNAPVEAAFTANPTTGDTPLDVYFSNQSSSLATSFEWLVNGTTFSTSENTSYTFSDSGTYVVSLVAFYQDVACSDTASYTIRVDQGIELMVPNIFTPNGDGRNDQLVAQVRGVKRLSWEVYNRWGNMLHSGASAGDVSQIELWNGGEAPSGVYSVILTAKGINGRVKRMDVAVTVVR